MQLEIGHMRRLPVPVLSSAQGEHLDAQGRRALAAKTAQDEGAPGEMLGSIEREIDDYVREKVGDKVKKWSDWIDYS